MQKIRIRQNLCPFALYNCPPPCYIILTAYPIDPHGDQAHIFIPQPCFGGLTLCSVRPFFVYKRRVYHRPNGGKEREVAEDIARTAEECEPFQR